MKISFTLIITVLLMILSSTSCTENNKIQSYTPPKIKGELTIDTLHGTIIQDPYRNMERINDTSLVNWYHKQTNYTNDILHKISNRDALTNHMIEIDNRSSISIRKNNVISNGTRFYLKKNKSDDRYKVYMKTEKLNEIELYDPINFKPENKKKYIINYIKPSWDGSHIVISLTHSGKEISEMIIINTRSKEILPEVIDNAWPSSFSGVNWLPDNSGFMYVHFPDINLNSPNFKKNTQSVVYKLGDPSSKIKYVFGNKTHPNLKISEDLFPIARIKSNTDKYIVGYIVNIENYWDAYYADINDLNTANVNWKPLYKKEDKIKTSRGVFKGDNYYFLTSKESPNFKLASVNINNLGFKQPNIIFEPKQEEVIKAFRVTKDAIYVTTSKYGIESFIYKIQDDKIVKLDLPKKAGNIYMYAKSISSNDIWISISGWTSSNERYKYDLDSNSFKKDFLNKAISYPEFKNIIAEEVLVTSHDGEQVPLSMIYNKNIEKNGKNPTFFYGYGAYGDSETPFFSPIFLSFIEQGGIICVPHVRGGGEKGEKWHKGGYKTTKPNTWKDLIACVEYMINKGFTSKKNTAIYSSSAGGIMVGRAMTERPDLFASVISEAGTLNPMRMEFDGVSGSNYEEFGTVKDSIECMALFEMDSYLHIKDSIDYPAIYLTVGMNDPRVVPWESGKFAARLQNATTLKKPVLLYADFNSGHEGSSDKKMYEEWGNVFSFALWQTGHPKFQTKD